MRLSILFFIFILLIAAALAVTITRKILPAVLVFMFYSLLMAVVWLLFESPDLAITEAAVGAGITSVLFFVTLRRIGVLEEEIEEEEANDENQR